MKSGKGRRGVFNGICFFIAYLIGGVFSDPLWQFALVWAVRWWNHDGPFKVVFGLFCTGLFMWCRERSVTSGPRKTVSGGNIDQRVA